VTVSVDDIRNATTRWIHVGKVTADDPQNQTVTYFVPSAGFSFTNPIRVDPATGDIFVHVGGILEAGCNHAEVIARDTDEWTATAQIHVTVEEFAGYELFVQGDGDSHKIAGNDVAQAVFPDCWFQSVLAAVAEQSPQIIESMTAKVGDDYEVRFYQKNEIGKFEPIWVPVVDNLQGAAGVVIGPDVDGAGKVEIWPRIIQQAYLRFAGGSPNIGGDIPSRTWEAITGFQANPTHVAPDLDWEDLTDAIDEGSLMWVGTAPGPLLVGGLAPTHIYRVVSYIAGPDPEHPATGSFVTLDNPHGANDATIEFENLKQAISRWWIE